MNNNIITKTQIDYSALKAPMAEPDSEFKRYFATPKGGTK